MQPYQFRYGHKQQFLGDFFEILLNTSIKQEAGQYFTLVPITRYIVSSLPIKEFIENKYSKSTLILFRIVLHTIFSSAIKNNLCRDNPAENIIIPVDAKVKKVKALTCQQQLMIKNNINKVCHGEYAIFMMDTEIRPGELRNLK